MERKTAGKISGGADLLSKADIKKRGDKIYYRVTSILGLLHPSSHQIPEEQLKQYGARGTLIHSEACEILGGTVNLNERRTAQSILDNGSLCMKPIDKNIIKNFMLKYPEYDWKNPVAIEETFYDDGLQLSGTADLFIKKKGELYLADWKTTQSYNQEILNKYFLQLGAYALLWERAGGEPVKGLVIFPLKPKNKYGYGTPYDTIEVEKYKNMFLQEYKTLNQNIK